MRGQGHHLTKDEVERMVRLLASTELSISQIAERMNCSSGAVIAINRKHAVRRYEGRRTAWTMATSAQRFQSAY